MGQPRIDEAHDVREGESLDIAKLGAYLVERLAGLEGPLTLRQFRGGLSNLTYLLHFANCELVLRRPPFGSKVKTAHDMSREYNVLSRLDGLYPKAPRALLHCDDLAVMGAPFYVMERVHGVILRHQGMPAEMDEPRMRWLSEAAIDGLAELHTVDWRAAKLNDLGRPQGYVARQVQGWTQRWRASRSDDVPAMDKAAAWLLEHQPSELGAALVHNDYKYDNLVLDPGDLTSIIAVLDWEMATLGDPLLDLGTTLAYWVDADDPEEMMLLPAGPTAASGGLRRVELVERYAQRTGADVSHILFYYVYGLFKVAVIAQQIYYRWKHGHTTDPRFSMMLAGVQLLGGVAARAIELGRIDRLRG
jgi:aminoglycoside phosphotransferase (APT) family kinase protein